MQYDVQYVRNQFPAIKLQVNGRPAVFLDGPGGTQVPQRVIDAMVHYLVQCEANAVGAFLTIGVSDRVIGEARAALATQRAISARAALITRSLLVFSHLTSSSMRLKSSARLTPARSSSTEPSGLR